jgi:hypothetical protein
MSISAKSAAGEGTCHGLAQYLAEIQFAEEHSDLLALGRGQIARTTRRLSQESLQPSAALRWERPPLAPSRPCRLAKRSGSS